MLVSLNSMQKEKERLIEITVDGKISGDELADFIFIQEKLERISVAVETLQLWAERMLATGAIDPEQYRVYKENQRSQERLICCTGRNTGCILLILSYISIIPPDTI